MTNVVWCTGCCGRCGEHFSSDTAFDHHRDGRYEVTDARGNVTQPNTRVCLDPYLVAKLEPKSTTGQCKVGRLYHPDGPRTGLTVWRVTQSDADLARLAAMRSSQGADSDLRPSALAPSEPELV